MRILAIDTALPAVSACVLDHDAEQPIASETIAMERGHAEAIMPLIERVMSKVDGGFSTIDRVAIAVGPGSFTGIRIGLAAGQAIALACKAEVVGVSTLAALAAPLILDAADSVVAAAIDARHGKVFVAAFGPDGRPLLTPRRAGAHEALRALGDGPLLLIGSGAELLAKEARSCGMAVKIVSEQAAPDIEFVARLGLAAKPETAPAKPLYLKEPDVTIAGKPPGAAQTTEAAPAEADAAPPTALAGTAPESSAQTITPSEKLASAPAQA
ncbi:tRNA (adenosine(37)-N6)-threonylcarbamoyltransferase complex dimerization subunit type 1 TsaB [Methylocystis sp. JR02]|uniref:tRNA (adenosine(37)-N6)-threonylcarbamoyltransferase complex dimerization subunit type 1 TsaB n=1 Tax=Methylocystis sp. JR02 TaxID=3046284 RepID=UPI0024BAF843|nr:tRNA (adenosine(37)-N6)-threonylcarbamoyltransferase complex dimerization subunit type 1 TsaB [Methylocystis sp. JR02]MDJ0448405.1 tRNA (adenosine(37)-N6)-threonylcarbamoyltransferase complex dimerization subunit type 1 TsaB [Methylocystis sp. JR02]